MAEGGSGLSSQQLYIPSDGQIRSAKVEIKRSDGSVETWLCKLKSPQEKRSLKSVFIPWSKKKQTNRDKIGSKHDKPKGTCLRPPASQATTTSISDDATDEIYDGYEDLDPVDKPKGTYLRPPASQATTTSVFDGDTGEIYDKPKGAALQAATASISDDATEEIYEVYEDHFEPPGCPCYCESADDIQSQSQERKREVETEDHLYETPYEKYQDHNRENKSQTRTPVQTRNPKPTSESTFDDDPLYKPFPDSNFHNYDNQSQQDDVYDNEDVSESRYDSELKQELYDESCLDMTPDLTASTESSADAELYKNYEMGPSYLGDEENLIRTDELSRVRPPMPLPRHFEHTSDCDSSQSSSESLSEWTKKSSISDHQSDSDDKGDDIYQARCRNSYLHLKRLTIGSVKGDDGNGSDDSDDAYEDIDRKICGNGDYENLEQSSTRQKIGRMKSFEGSLTSSFDDDAYDRIAVLEKLHDDLQSSEYCNWGPNIEKNEKSEADGKHATAAVNHPEEIVFV